MYIVPPLWSHILWLYWGLNDSELILWVKTHIRLGIRSVSRSDQSPRYTHEETLSPYLPIAKFRGVSPRNLAECLREMSRSFSANFCGENPRRNKWFLFFSTKIIISRKGCIAAKRKKELFSWSDLCLGMQSQLTMHAFCNFFLAVAQQKHRWCHLSPDTKKRYLRKRMKLCHRRLRAVWSGPLFLFTFKEGIFTLANSIGFEWTAFWPKS